MTDEQPPSAVEWARAQGAVPSARSVTPATLDLVERARDLVDAAVRTDLPDADRLALAGDIRRVVEALLRSIRAAPVVVVEHEGGRIENVTQAGSGRLNPQAPAVDFVDPLPAPPPPGSGPVPVEVSARSPRATAPTSASGAGGSRSERPAEGQIPMRWASSSRWYVGSPKSSSDDFARLK